VSGLRQLTPPGEPDVLAEVLNSFCRGCRSEWTACETPWAAGNIEEDIVCALAQGQRRKHRRRAGFTRCVDSSRPRAGWAISTGSAAFVDALGVEFGKVEVEIRVFLATADCHQPREYDYMIVQRYPEPFIAPMRAELSRLGFEDLTTPDAVDAAVKQPGTTMIVVNSVCGCAAGKARPGIALALSKGKRPDRLATVFAGADVEATQTARDHFAPYPPHRRRLRS
jgi:putative YphP/YqiW family bacilliredoxin